MKERCQEVEELYKNHDLFNLHKKVKEITGNRKYPVFTHVLNQDNKQITDDGELREVWTKYIANTFESNSPPFCSQDDGADTGNTPL